MASSIKRAKRGKILCCGGPGLRSCTNTYHVEGISMHKFPENEEQRKNWIKLVRRHQPNFVPSKSSVICSTYFEKSCFATRYHVGVPDELKPKARYLTPGSVPTKDTVILDEMPTTSRAKRRIIRHQLSPLSGDSNQDEEEHTTSDEDEADKIELDEMPTQETACESPILSDNPNEESFISEDQELLRCTKCDLEKEKLENLQRIVESLRQEMSSSSSEDESRSNYDSDENKTGEDIGILDEALDDEDGSLANSSEGELIDNFRDPDWNANMEDEETDSSADDELEDDGEEVREGTSQDA
ncbi:uncharacterized protein LOC114544898, partial [Dendronephthya gigantea]|uniref:uncharacterized protein LOC114544898 n=1 Tax=Dendronephthya gigantea TaxID=151771 RepID=UPI00106DD193